IACGYDLSTVDLGASIACSGVCLTVVDKGANWFAVDVSAETRSRTAPSMWDEGKTLNLERALRVGEEMGGHIVTGHVDAVVEVVALDRVGDSLSLTIAAPPALASYLATKGSVTLDGVSLTVNEVKDAADGADTRFGINLIPHTQAQTNFADMAVGRQLNIEIDILARYLGRMLDARSTGV
ncbi:MAG: riboflavin synthase, partial [Allosphingosinicella sp.]